MGYSESKKKIFSVSGPVQNVSGGGHGRHVLLWLTGSL